MHSEAVQGQVLRYRCRDIRCPSYGTDAAVTIERHADLRAPYASSGSDMLCADCKSIAEEVRSSR